MIILDTHIFLWLHLKDENLSPREKKILKSAFKNGELGISAISIWEIAMLEKNENIAFHIPLQSWLDQATIGFKIISINEIIALESVSLPNLELKDPADRFIIATTRALGGKLMSHDKHIIRYGKKGYISIA